MPWRETSPSSNGPSRHCVSRKSATVSSSKAQMLFGKWSSGPREPAVRAILAPIPILKRDRIQTLCQLLTFLNGCLAVGGMDELKKRFRHQLTRGISEHFFPGRIEALEVSVIP